MSIERYYSGYCRFLICFFSCGCLQRKRMATTQRHDMMSCFFTAPHELHWRKEHSTRSRHHNLLKLQLSLVLSFSLHSSSMYLVQSTQCDDFVLWFNAWRVYLHQNVSREKAARQAVRNAVKSVWSRPTLVQIPVEYYQQSTSLVGMALNLPCAYGRGKGTWSTERWLTIHCQLNSGMSFCHQQQEQMTLERPEWGWCWACMVLLVTVCSSFATCLTTAWH